MFCYSRRFFLYIRPLVPVGVFCLRRYVPFGIFSFNVLSVDVFFTFGDFYFEVLKVNQIYSSCNFFPLIFTTLLCLFLYLFPLMTFESVFSNIFCIHPCLFDLKLTKHLWKMDRHGYLIWSRSRYIEMINIFVGPNTSSYLMKHSLPILAAPSFSDRK